MRSALLDSTSYLLVRAAKAHRALVADGLAELRLHVGQELVLAQLWHEDGLRPSQLADRLGIERPTVTKVLKGMERGELVLRQPDDEDARASCVWLTDRGRSLRDPVERVWKAAERATLQGLGPGERDRLKHALSRMRANLE